MKLRIPEPTQRTVSLKLDRVEGAFSRQRHGILSVPTEGTPFQQGVFKKGMTAGLDCKRGFGEQMNDSGTGHQDARTVEISQAVVMVEGTIRFECVVCSRCIGEDNAAEIALEGV